MIYIAMIWDMPKCFDFLKNIFIDLYYVRVWTQNLRQSRKSSHNSSTKIRCLKTDFLNEIAQVYLRNMILQKKDSYFKCHYHNFIIVTPFFKIDLFLFCLCLHSKKDHKSRLISKKRSWFRIYNIKIGELRFFLQNTISGIIWVLPSIITLYLHYNIW